MCARFEEGWPTGLTQSLREEALARIAGRARAAFLGVALGDALGATTEFMTTSEIRASYGVHREIVGGGWLRLRPGRVTDDTELSVSLARAVVEAGAWDPAAVAERFAQWLKRGPVDVGATCRRGIRAYLLTGRLETRPDPGDAGNGAVMRMAPAALVSLGAPDLLERIAVEQAHLTHNHPLSDAACVTVGRMIQKAILGGSPFELHALTRELSDRHPAFGVGSYRGECSGYVVDTLRTVFHHFFSTASFEECLVAVVNQGGDADTTGAIAGALAGAFYGPESLPSRWLRRLDPSVREEVVALAEQLVGLSPLARGARCAAARTLGR